MKTNDCLNKEGTGSWRFIPLSETQRNKRNPNLINNLRKLFYVAAIAGMGLFFNSCMSGYVAMEPSYIVMQRPPQPSSIHIWIDGGWRWSSQSHAYVQNTGYWQKPRQSQTYISGHWQSTSQGKSWERGRWQKQSSQRGNQNRKNHR
jgi:hypothetical protein